MKIHLSCSGFELDSELEKYAAGKAAQMAKGLPRKLRPHASCTIHFAQGRAGGAKISTCSVRLTAGQASFTAEESTQHMYAALDIATVNIAQQVLDHVTRTKPPSRGWLLP